MVKWTSKKGKELQEEIKVAVLSGDWGNIFAPKFDPKDFEYSDLRESNDEWKEAFSQKQFRANVTKMIERMIIDHARAETEADDLGANGTNEHSHVFSLCLVPFIFLKCLTLFTSCIHTTDIDDEAEGLEEDMANLNLSSPDPRKTVFQMTVSQFGAIGNNNAFVRVRVQHPHGAIYPSIKGRDVVITSVIDPDLYNAAPMFHDPLFNNLEGGVFLQAFSAAGRAYIKDESDWQQPERVTNESVYTAPFDIEQNFVSHGGVPGIRMWCSTIGNCFVELTVVQLRSNHHASNANAQQQQQHPAPQPPFQQQHHAPPPPPHHQPQQPAGFQQQPPQPPQHQAPPAAQQQQQQQHTTQPQQQYQAPFAAAATAAANQQPQQQPFWMPWQQHYTSKHPSPPSPPSVARMPSPQVEEDEFGDSKPAAKPTKTSAKIVFENANNVAMGGSDTDSSHMKPPPHKFYAGGTATTQDPNSTPSTVSY